MSINMVNAQTDTLEAVPMTEPEIQLTVEFERELTGDEIEISAYIIENRLHNFGIFTLGTMPKDNKLVINLISKQDQDDVKQILKPVGKLDIMSVINPDDAHKILEKANKQLSKVRRRNNDIFRYLSISNEENDSSYDPKSKAVTGYCDVRDSLALMELLNHESVQEALPEDVILKWKRDEKNNKLLLVLLTKIENTEVPNQTMIERVTSGENQSGERELTVILNKEGAEQWTSITQDFIGNHLAVLIDAEVFSLLEIQSPIENGRVNISPISHEDMRMYRNVLSVANAFPAKVKRIH